MSFMLLYLFCDKSIYYFGDCGAGAVALCRVLAYHKEGPRFNPQHHTLQNWYRIEQWTHKYMYYQDHNYSKDNPK